MSKKNRLREILMKDFLWKLLSLTIAVCLWFVVINIENPSETRSFPLTLEILNTERVTNENKIISNYDEIKNLKVSAKIRGQRISLDRLYQNRDKIQAYIDLTAIKDLEDGASEHLLNVQIKIPPNLGDSYEIDSRTPSNITVKIENKLTKTFPVELAADLSGYSNPDVLPLTVEVSGSESLVNLVSRVKVVMEASAIQEDTTYTGEIIPYDSNGQRVYGVSLSTKNASVYIPMKSSKKIKIIPDIMGAAKEGYSYESITCSPEEVYVTGSDALLKDMEAIKLPPVNISDKDEDMEIGFSIKSFLPLGVNLKNGEEEKVVVKVVIVKETVKDVTLMYDNISYIAELEEGLIAEIAPADISLQLKGSQEILEGVKDEDIKGSIVISMLEEGEYRLPVQVQIPKGTRLTEAESPYITVVIKKTEEISE